MVATVAKIYVGRESRLREIARFVDARRMVKLMELEGAPCSYFDQVFVHVA